MKCEIIGVGWGGRWGVNRKPHCVGGFGRFLFVCQFALPSFLSYPGSPRRRIPAPTASAFVRVVSGSLAIVSLPAASFVPVFPVGSFLEYGTIERRQCRTFIDGCETSLSGKASLKVCWAIFLSLVGRQLSIIFIDLTKLLF